MARVYEVIVVIGGVIYQIVHFHGAGVVQRIRIGSIDTLLVYYGDRGLEFDVAQYRAFEERAFVSSDVFYDLVGIIQQIIALAQIVRFDHAEVEIFGSGANAVRRRNHDACVAVGVDGQFDGYRQTGISVQSVGGLQSVGTAEQYVAARVHDVYVVYVYRRTARWSIGRFCQMFDNGAEQSVFVSRRVAVNEIVNVARQRSGNYAVYACQIRSRIERVRISQLIRAVRHFHEVRGIAESRIVRTRVRHEVLALDDAFFRNGVFQFVQLGIGNRDRFVIIESESYRQSVVDVIEV